MSEPFESAWLKWGWAVVHAYKLNKQLLAYSAAVEPKGGQAAFTETEYDPKRHCVILRLVSIEPLPVEWSLRLGDTANNFRACLDHLAWALVSRGHRAGRLTKRQKRNVYFPLAATKDEFDSALNRLPGLRVADRAIIRRYQPYFRGKRNVPNHCFTPLGQLNAEDKHRSLRPVWAFPESGWLEYGESVDCTITSIPSQAPRLILEADTELQRIYVRKTGPNPDVYMEAHITAHPTIDGRIELNDWMRTTTRHTLALLREFAYPPEKILHLWAAAGIQQPAALLANE